MAGSVRKTRYQDGLLPRLQLLPTGARSGRGMDDATGQAYADFVQHAPGRAGDEPHL